MHAEIDEILSTLKIFQFGVPQGKVLEPLIFNILMIYFIPIQLEKFTAMLMILL